MFQTSCARPPNRLLHSYDSNLQKKKVTRIVETTLMILYSITSRCALPRRIFMDMESQSTVLAVFQSRSDFYCIILTSTYQKPTLRNMHIEFTHSKMESKAKLARSESCTAQRGYYFTCIFQNLHFPTTVHFDTYMKKDMCIQILIHTFH